MLYVSVYLYIYLSIYLSIYPPIYPPIYLSICLSIPLSILDLQVCGAAVPHLPQPARHPLLIPQDGADAGNETRGHPRPWAPGSSGPLQTQATQTQRPTQSHGDTHQQTHGQDFQITRDRCVNVESEGREGGGRVGRRVSVSVESTLVE